MKRRNASRRPDQQVVDDFVVFLQGHGHPGLRVGCRPEECADREIDAIAGPFAIEHTSVDAVGNQRESAAHFGRVIGGLREELEGKIEFRLSITVEWSAVELGQDWAVIRQAMKDWILSKAQLLPDGCHLIQDDIRDVPFALLVRKASDRPRGVLFGRRMPKDDTLPARIRKQLDAKAAKLAKYRPNKTTILLVESSDIALMNQSILIDAIQKAYSGARPDGVDQVWYADTSVTGSDHVYTDLTPQLR